MPARGNPVSFEIEDGSKCRRLPDEVAANVEGCRTAKDPDRESETELAVDALYLSGCGLAAPLDSIAALAPLDQLQEKK